jgi:hypothetical protein
MRKWLPLALLALLLCTSCRLGSGFDSQARASASAVESGVPVPAREALPARATLGAPVVYLQVAG